MWDYEKLFAIGNIVGIKNETTKELGIYQITNDKELPKDAQYCQYGKYWIVFANTELSLFNVSIQYIIRLDEHGNVVERLFNRDTDIPKPMPELETGMFILIFNYDHTETRLGYINAERNMIIYQSGGWDYIDGNKDKILKIYSTSCNCFDGCNEHHVFWRSPKHQDYLDSKSN